MGKTNIEWPIIITTRNYLIYGRFSMTFLDNITNGTTSMMFFYFPSCMCIDGYWSPKHSDVLLNFSQSGPERVTF